MNDGTTVTIDMRPFGHMLALVALLMLGYGVATCVADDKPPTAEERRVRDGDRVFYVLESGEVRPAVVVVFDVFHTKGAAPNEIEPDDAVNLTAFLNGPDEETSAEDAERCHRDPLLLFCAYVRHDEDGHKPGTWHRRR